VSGAGMYEKIFNNGILAVCFAVLQWSRDLIKQVQFAAFDARSFSFFYVALVFELLD
jgi:hypothetical protein